MRIPAAVSHAYHRTDPHALHYPRGVEQSVARWPHKPKAAGSSPAAATMAAMRRHPHACAPALVYAGRTTGNGRSGFKARNGVQS